MSDRYWIAAYGAGSRVSMPARNGRASSSFSPAAGERAFHAHIRRSSFVRRLRRNSTESVYGVDRCTILRDTSHAHMRVNDEKVEREYIAMNV